MKRSRNFSLLISLLLFNCLSAAEQSRLPNIVFLLADDLGGADLHCYGHPYSRTPNIDSLARDGTRFIQSYSTDMTCCPARTGLMTSKFPATYATYPEGGGFGDRITITELLKKKGYTTGHFGKWHIGPVDKPGTYGIDSVLISNGGGREDELGRDAKIYDDAIHFIEQNKDGPFYVNVWGHISHSKVDPHDSLVTKWIDLKVNEQDFPPPMIAKFSAVHKGGGNVDDGMRRYLADVESLDMSVGKLLKRLDELGLRDNTIIVFSSDQGCDMGKVEQGGLRFNMMGSNGPMRGGKHTDYEGGVRVPWIVRWPGHVSVGRTDEKSVISGVDWLPTLAAITGIKINSQDFDGEDASAAWLGTETHVRTKPLFWKTNALAGVVKIREGKWKMNSPQKKSDELELYDIEADPLESKNLAAQYPDVVKMLKAKIDTWIATLPKNYINTGDKQD